MKNLLNYLLFCFCLMTLNANSQETSVQLSPLKLLGGGVGAILEQQIGVKSSVSGQMHYYQSSRGILGVFRDCEGTTAKVVYRYYLGHKIGGLRGLYLAPGFKYTTYSCFNGFGIRPKTSALGLEFGFQAIEKGGFTFNIFVSGGFNLSSSYGEDFLVDGGVSFGYTFGDRIKND